MPKPRREIKKPEPIFTLAEGKDGSTNKDLKSINWSLLDEKLPSDRSEASKRKRSSLFRQMDPNGNGYLSVAEIEKGLMIVLHYDTEVKRVVKKSVLRAHNGAKAAVPSDSKKKDAGDDYVEKHEFRVFCEFFKYDLKILMMFLEMDSSDDLRLDKEEFVEHLPKILEATGLPPPKDIDEVWNSMDADGGGKVLYDEFADFMVKHKVANPSAKVIKAAATSPAPKRHSIKGATRPAKVAPKSSTRRPTSKPKPHGKPPRRTVASKSLGRPKKPQESKGHKKSGPSVEEVISTKFAEFEEKMAKYIDAAIAKHLPEFMETLVSKLQEAGVAAPAAKAEPSPAAEVKAEKPESKDLKDPVVPEEQEPEPELPTKTEPAKFDGPAMEPDPMDEPAPMGEPVPMGEPAAIDDVVAPEAVPVGPEE